MTTAKQTLSKDEWQEMISKENALLNEALGKTIKFAIRDTTIKQFAEDIFYARPAVTCMLNQKATDTPQKNWTLALLIAVSKSLNIKLSTLIAEAEGVAAGSAPGLNLRLSSTAPRSRERLQKLIYAAVNYCGDLDEKKYDGVLEVLYRVKDVEYAVPTFWGCYQKGTLGDSEALSVINSAVRIQDAAEGEAPPFWEALRQSWEAFSAENPLSENN